MIDDEVIITHTIDENGNEVTHFEPKVQHKDMICEEKEELSFLDRLWNFITKHEIKPYAKIDNLNKPTERDSDLKSHRAIEIGIKGTF